MHIRIKISDANYEQFTKLYLKGFKNNINNIWMAQIIPIKIITIKG